LFTRLGSSIISEVYRIQIKSLNYLTMKISFNLVLLASMAAATPLTARDAPSMEQALQDMISGAVNYPTAALKGDKSGMDAALGQMTGGATSFSPGFFNDLGKGTKALGSVSTRDAPSMEQSLQDMISGAVGYPMAALKGDKNGMSAALAQMTGGAASFSPGFFNDLGKGFGKTNGTEHK
jgi:hypothetical protein